MSNYFTSDISIFHYLALGTSIFVIGIFGLLSSRRNIISVLLSIELMLLAVNINLVSFSCYLNNFTGQIFTIFILTVAAAEAAVGLAIMLRFYRNKGAVTAESANELRG